MNIRKSLVLLFALLITPSLCVAGSIQSIKSLSSSKDYEVVITTDKPLKYSVFDLQNRIKIAFSNASVANTVSNIQSDGITKSVDITGSKTAPVIVINTGKDYRYKIKDYDNKIILKIVNSKQIFTRKITTIKSMDIKESGNTTILNIHGINMDKPYRSFNNNKNTQLIIDFNHGNSLLTKSHFEFPGAHIKSATVASDNDRLRLVINTLRNGDNGYRIATTNKTMSVAIGNGHVKPDSSLVVNKVDFQPDDRIAHVIVRTNRSDPFIHMENHGSTYIMEIKHATTIKGNIRTMDVHEFPGPVSTITTTARHHDIIVTVHLREHAVARTFQDGNDIHMTFEPSDMLKLTTRIGGSETTYLGQKVDMDFQGMDIRHAIRLITKESKLNVIISDAVQGTVNLSLHQVPWDQALDMILTSHNLAKEQNGNVLHIDSYEAIQNNIARRNKAKQDKEKVDPLHTEFFHLGYAKVSDMKAILQPKDKKAGVSITADASAAASASGKPALVSADQSIKLLSPRGTILMDERSNTLVITDTEKRLNNIKRLLSVLDRPSRQVMVEAHIIEASSSFSRDLGVKWGGSYNDNGAGRFTHNLHGAQLGNNIVDLGAAVAPGAGGAIGYTLGTLSNAFNINLELSAAEGDGKIKVLSEPRIFTRDMQKAKIEETKDIPFTQTTFAGGVATTSTVSKLARLTLEVTPQITADGSIVMDLNINKDTPQVNTLSTNGQPIIDRKNITTSLLVKNGQTIILGGIFIDSSNNNTNGVPGLKDMPLIGGLFKHKLRSHGRTELMVFITPTIVGIQDMKLLMQDRDKLNKVLNDIKKEDKQQ